MGLSIDLPLVHLLASAQPVPSGLRFPGTTWRVCPSCDATQPRHRVESDEALPNAPRLVTSPSAI